MENILTPSNITFILGVLAIIFSVYSYFRNPQIKSDKTDALLTQKLQWTIEGNEKRFSDVNINIEKAFNLAQNHIHTVDIKVDKLIENVSLMSNEITKLSTIIEERVPKK